MNLFALTQGPARRILRIPLSRAIQIQVGALFRQQEADFVTSAEEEHAFDGSYTPVEGESLVIAGYDDVDNIHHAIEHPLGIPEIPPDPDAFETVKALFVGYRSDGDEPIALIQGFNRRRIISPTGFTLLHSADTYRRVDSVGLTLDNRLAAMLVGTNLRFLSFHVVRQILDLSAYFAEATVPELRAFARTAGIHVADEEAFVALADTWVRKKVTLIGRNRILDTVSSAAIRDAALAFGIEIETVQVNGREAISLPGAKADLKTLLKFLDEDYYRSPIQGRNYVTNSKRPI
ncbi:hypothetical protein MKK64_05325 [Methylobacterium sp. E-025]|jgi:hypothetical protein|uniref:hypothetical protein n=1 Tax=unclassified Methylobacterium TaxID=2615210 RepID=UPI001FB9EAC7|nr:MULTISPECIES: hypothetical protein [unclassified Methylobacterium]MCJ2041528.1 hypothetical protein [Methylobacterium sp. J-059]MCJ2110626.1 hypothetical protein [Methylobacterium sp. E-025]